MSDKTVLVLDATGQQGGSAAAALKDDGWHVRALVRNPKSPKACALSAAGIETVRGDLADTASVRAAVAGAHGVFSVLPSSGQFVYGVSDADEVRFGNAVADAANEAGVEHLVYSSSNAAGSKTGSVISTANRGWRTMSAASRSTAPLLGRAPSWKSCSCRILGSRKAG